MEKEKIRNKMLCRKMNKLIIGTLCLNRISERHDTAVFRIKNAQLV